MSNGGRGSTSNVISAIASFFLPGLGQLVQGRILAALIFFLLSAFLWFVWLGWLGHIWACIDAALWKGVRQRS
jgi:TM2 domain-containing membrane protein YozV